MCAIGTEPVVEGAEAFPAIAVIEVPVGSFGGESPVSEGVVPIEEYGAVIRIQNLRWFKMVQNGLKWFKMVQDGQRF